MRLLSVDTGISGCGCALWRDGFLERAAYVPSPVTPRYTTSERVRHMYVAVVDWRDQDDYDPLITRVVEYPRTYGGRAKRGDANDLVLEALVAGALVSWKGEHSILVLPQEWKGSAPKEVTRERCREDLSPEELERVKLPKDKKKQLDVFDAIGIGLWYLKKEGKR